MWRVATKFGFLATEILALLAAFDCIYQVALFGGESGLFPHCLKESQMLSRVRNNDMTSSDLVVRF